MIKQKHLRVALLVAAISSVGVASANLVTNGSFEEIAIANNTYLTVTPGNASTNLPGWTVTGTSVDIVSGPDTWPAYDGNQSIDIAGTPGPGAVQQTIATTAGEWYLIEFALGDNYQGTGDKSVDFTFGNYTENIAGAIGQGNWLLVSRYVQADSAATLLEFSTDNAGFYGGLVDAVTVTAVPEPATMAVLGLGAAALMRRRRRK